MASSRDSAGVQTDVVYDAEGRLLVTMPADSSSTVYQYQLPTAEQLGLVPQITVLGCGAGQTTCAAGASLSWARFVTDGLGRRVQDLVRYPSTTGIRQEARTRTYNGMGWLTFETSWGSTTAGTSYSDFDRFGRAGTIIPPGQPTMRVVYQGDRVRSQLNRVRLSTGVVDNWRTEIYNRWERLTNVCEGESAAWGGTCDGTGIETAYEYDVAHRLTRVCQDLEGSACAQERQFSWDGRGVLIRERHPEQNLVNVTYTYNAKGQPLTVDLAGSTEYDQTIEYDAAGRTIRVSETRDGDPRLLSELFYAATNDGMNFQAGKLVLRKRHNWIRKVPPLSGANVVLPKDEDVVVADAFRYEGRDGRESERQTRITAAIESGEISVAFNTAVTYHANGNPNSVSYPVCLADCNGLAPDRVVSTTYQKGFVKTIPGFVTDVNYQRGGTLHALTTQNGVVTTIETDTTTGLQRPARITTSAGLDTGTYAYDGSSNVTAIGSLQYRYDRFNLGSLVSLTSHGSTLTLTTDPATNRLVSPLAEYDGGGNQVVADFTGTRFEYDYDAAGMLKSVQSDTGIGRLHLYNAANQRIATWNCGDPDCTLPETDQTWTLRGLDGEALRVFRRAPNGTWNWEADYVHRESRAVATVSPAGTFFLHHDHLGSVRQVTDAAGTSVATHNYYPFGGEVTDPGQDAVVFKFTGHERQEDGNGTLDYMGARYCSPVLGRFTAVDPATKRVATNHPQEWNRYAYVQNNPLRLVDPDGRESAGILLDQDVRALTEGRITREQFTARVRARGVGALAATPAAYGVMKLSAGAIASSGIRGAQSLAGRFFHLGPAPRGFQIEFKLAEFFPGQLPKTFPTIDRFANGVATSVKSVDLTLKSGRGSALVRKLNGFIDKLSKFKSGRRKGVDVDASQIQQRVLELAVNRAGLSPEAVGILNQFIERARQAGIVVKIFLTS